MLDCPRSDLHLSLKTPALRRESSFEPAADPAVVDDKNDPGHWKGKHFSWHPQLRILQQLRAFVANFQIFQFLLVY
jgi:hypothetical protein